MITKQYLVRKKLILIFVILMVLTSCLYSTELEDKNIMPQELYENELPSDYPRELEDLFRYYYNFAIELSKSVQDINDAGDYVATYYDMLSIETVLSFCYLDWLANNSIRAYYDEYRHVNKLKGSKLVEHPSPIFDDLSYNSKIFSDSTIVGWYAMPVRIQHSMHQRVIDYSDDLRTLFGGFGCSIWLRCRVLDSEIIELDKIYSISTIQVEEVFGSKFPYPEIVVRVYLYSGYYDKSKMINPFIPDSEYFFPLRVYKQTIDEIKYKDSVFENGDIYYSAVEDQCYLINDENEIINPTGGRNIALFGNDVDWDEVDRALESQMPPSSRNTFQKLPYSEVKERIEVTIELLRLNYERWGL